MAAMLALLLFFLAQVLRPMANVCFREAAPQRREGWPKVRNGPEAELDFKRSR